MRLSETQQEFTRDIARLIIWADSLGLALTVGEFYRTPAQARLNSRAGIGISNSNHTRRLAADLNLFVGGVYQTTTDAHKPLGDYWKGLNPNNVWGGDFKRRDGNHYSRRYGKYPV
ncbi:MAG: M15 family metallopeptidase [Gammaproteobacteria bacterium]|nr:M15 family metallopeptidase [Gammaproteobacteria bacterium]MCP4275550.1 M15 family metallopeptidase [Gammaproteobacteria bacterium]